VPTPDESVQRRSMQRVFINCIVACKGRVHVQSASRI
jgi:hypothetical protein